MNSGGKNRERFVNPYNFVSLDGRCERHPAEYYREGERLTGYIECSLTTLTPLIIPNTSNDKALHTSRTWSEQSYDFYSYTNLERAKDGAALKKFHEPVIPGSELRGVIRSVYEAAFKGCLSTADVGRTMYRRTMRPKEPGILRKVEGKWMIELCERYLLSVSPARSREGNVSRESHERWKEGAEVSVKVEGEDVSLKPEGNKTKKVVDIKDGHVTADGFQQGYLHKGEAFQNKKTTSVFVPKRDKDNNKTLIPVHEDEIKRLEKVLSQYMDPKLNRHIDAKGHTGYAEYRKVFDQILQTGEQGQLLVYYSTYKPKETEEVQATYLTPAMISKEVYLQTIGALLKANEEYQPCTERSHVCPACGLFGMAGEKPKTSLGSRIRFSDAEYVSNDSNRSREGMYWSILLPELGAPKPGAVEFYTLPPVQTNSGYKKWTYDDVLEAQRKFRLLEPQELRLRGRKFYWHHTPKERKNNSRSDQSNRNVAMQKEVRAVKKGNNFHFRIYFDQVTIKELAQLYWSLALGNSDQYAHKIGHGKPLGYGSAKIKPENIWIRRIDSTSGLRTLSLLDSKELEKHTATLSIAMGQLQHLLNYKSSISEHVSYPKVRFGKKPNKINDSASHQWFKANMTSTHFLKVLPTVEQEVGTEQSAHLFELFKHDKGS
ncbi:TIGR03986 family CRISPR-associated RAMP protein [Brevibacillus parabrevis]|uniref:TIGR03986 family type III CRISPR-associated RAMP protein n=1 Tax=Brevibacillus parabrevis TaxID=54914 RepID=UPI0028D31464|nr:TIGR03986 family CRISPR-associated RAMP protein [Brevibacillus parabrevis]